MSELFKYDLHIHSCLSPCGDLESSPAAIAAQAKEVGLDGIMLADHNTARNAPALFEACRRCGIAALAGMEITTAEEAHCLAVFDTLEQALEMTEVVYSALPRRENVPKVFGDQPVVDADDNILEFEPRMLSAPTRLTIRETGEHVHRLGGLFVAAHLDRPVFSVTSQLGSLSGDEGFDAVELTRRAVLEEWRGRVLGLPVIRSSDAHYLHDIGKGYSMAELQSFCVAELQRAWQRG